MLKQIKSYLGRIVDSRKSAAILSNLTPKERELISSIRAKRLTYLSEKKLASLASTCRLIEDANLPGIF